MYEYRCKLIRILDGDTVELEIDQGLRGYRHEICRLRGIDTAELHDEPEKAQAALDHLAAMLQRTPLKCKTFKDRTGKYGRYLVTLFDNRGRDINQQMITDGFAKRYGT